MKSALECFQRAAECERLARQAVTDSNRTTLLAAARQWRKLGEWDGCRAEEIKFPDSINDREFKIRTALQMENGLTASNCFDGALDLVFRISKFATLR